MTCSKSIHSSRAMRNRTDSGGSIRPVTFSKFLVLLRNPQPGFEACLVPDEKTASMG
ncbi:hypothetical protein CEB3_c00640 [Peptococcaceae bacterium CEB3]|nr:hypothetical protein CEB3_c00640 [Peptococcaceae bacterium CEB3]